MSTRLYNQVRSEAFEVLMTCTSSSQRERVAWAAGVWAAPHALTFHTIPVRPADLAPEHQGYSGGGLRLVADRSGVVVSRCQDGVPERVITVSWPEIAALITPTRVGAELHAQIREALTQRTTLPVRWHSARPSNQQPSAAEVERQRRWDQNDDRCYDLGAQVWDRCRPGEQHALFELLEVAG